MFVQPRQCRLDFQGFSVEFSPHVDNLIAVGTSQHFGIVGNGKQCIFECFPDGEMRLHHEFHIPEAIYDCSWNEVNPDQIVSACGNGSIKLFDVNVSDGFPIADYHSHHQDVASVQWNPCVKTTFASASWDGTIKIWDPMRNLELVNFVGHDGCVYNGSWHPRHATTIASCSADRTIRVWDANIPEKQQMIIQAHTNEVLALDWDKYNEYHLVSGSVDRLIKIWDTRQPQLPVRILEGHTQGVKRLKCSPHTQGLIGSVSYDMSCRFWNANLPGQPLYQTNNHHSEFVVGIDFSLFVEGLVATTAWDRSVQIWNLHGILPPPCPLLSQKVNIPPQTIVSS